MVPCQGWRDDVGPFGLQLVSYQCYNSVREENEGIFVKQHLQGPTACDWNKMCH